VTQYQRGVTFERMVRHDLEEMGFEVIRSAGSKGKVDLVAFRPGCMVFVQCKLNGLCPPAERRELLRLAGMVEALPIVAYKGTEGRLRPTRYRQLTGEGPKQFTTWPVRVLPRLGAV
jgi:holliday junction resolvase